jgi:hypothetical protein
MLNSEDYFYLQQLADRSSGPFTMFLIFRAFATTTADDNHNNDDEQRASTTSSTADDYVYIIIRSWLGCRFYFLADCPVTSYTSSPRTIWTTLSSAIHSIFAF